MAIRTGNLTRTEVERFVGGIQEALHETRVSKAPKSLREFRLRHAVYFSFPPEVAFTEVEWRKGKLIEVQQKPISFAQYYDSVLITAPFSVEMVAANRYIARD